MRLFYISCSDFCKNGKLTSGGIQNFESIPQRLLVLVLKKPLGGFLIGKVQPRVLFCGPLGPCSPWPSLLVTTLCICMQLTWLCACLWFKQKAMYSFMSVRRIPEAQNFTVILLLCFQIPKF